MWAFILQLSIESRKVSSLTSLLCNTFIRRAIKINFLKTHVSTNYSTRKLINMSFLIKYSLGPKISHFLTRALMYVIRLSHIIVNIYWDKCVALTGTGTGTGTGRVLDRRFFDRHTTLWIVFRWCVNIMDIKRMLFQWSEWLTSFLPLLLIQFCLISN